MDQNLVFAKTSLGEEAVRQSTRVVQRNLRMVLVQVDGKLSVGELAAKIGNVRLVEAALKELENGGYIAPGQEAVAAWEESRKTSRKGEGLSALSQMSMFGPRSVMPVDPPERRSQSSAFSTFGKPILAAPRNEENERDVSSWGNDRPADSSETPPLPVLRWLAWGSVAFLFLLILVLALFPYDRFRPEVAAGIEKVLQVPVSVGDLRVNLLPSPQVIAGNVRIGNASDAVIERVSLPSPFSLMVSGLKSVTEIRVSGMVLPADRLLALGGTKFPENLRRIVVEHARVTASNLTVNELGGEILLANGGLEKISLQTADRTLRIEATPAASGLLLNLEGYGWRPVSDQPIAFDVMRGKATLKNGRLLFEEIDSTFMGGVLKGSAVLDWSNGINLVADLQVARLDIKHIASLLVPKLNLEGELSGSLRLRNSGRDADSFWGSTEMSMIAEINRGILHGVDLGEAARRGNGYIVRSGSTKFDTLRAELGVDSKGLVARNIAVDAGMMTISGQLTARRSLEVDGDLVVSMRTSVSGLRVPVRIAGTLPSLVASAGR